MLDISTCLTTAEAQEAVKRAATAAGVVVGAIKFTSPEAQGFGEPEIRQMCCTLTVKGSTHGEIVANLEAVARRIGGEPGTECCGGKKRAAPDDPTGNILVRFYARGKK